MIRREFITLACCIATVPRAIAAARTARVAILTGTGPGDPEHQRRVQAFEKRLEELGWTGPRLEWIEQRAAMGNPDLLRAYAAEIVALRPNVILVQSTPALAALRNVTRSIPTVFVQVSDPVRSGFAESLARPGGNLTGFSNFERSLGGKWLELLMQIGPKLRRALVLMDAALVDHSAFLQAAQEAAIKGGVEITPANVGSVADIQRAMGTFANDGGGGMIVLPHNLTTTHRQLILEEAANRRIPAVYPFRFFAEEGGLVSYGLDVADLFRRAAEYVDRILQGQDAGTLPVQQPTRFEFVINLKTAQVLGLEVPASLSAQADAVIE
jgi:putative ABC transport system substrate-binding protein